MTIILVRQRIETLGRVAHALAALIGSGVVKTFDNPDDPKHPDPFRLPATTQAIAANCDDSKAGYAKKGFYEAGFQVATATGPAPDPGDNDPVELTVTPDSPEKKDDVTYYPIGIGDGAVMSAKALHGAFVTRSIGDDQAFIGDDPDTSIRVSCNRADISRVQGGFGASHFKATP